MRRLLILVACVTVLAGCAGAPARVMPAPAGGGDFALAGRVAVRTPERADMLRIDWQRHGDEDLVRLETPLGQTVAEVHLTPAGHEARLGDGRVLRGQSDAALAGQLLGAEIPLSRLADWVRGRAGAEARDTVRDPAGRPLSASVGDWRLAWAGWGEVDGAADAPARVDATRGGLSVRLRIERWASGAPQ